MLGDLPEEAVDKYRLPDWDCDGADIVSQQVFTVTASQNLPAKL